MHIDEAVKVFRKGIIDFLAKFPWKEYPICSYLFEEADRYFPAGPGFRWDSANITLDLTTGDLMVHLGTYPVHGRTTESTSSMSAASFAGHAKEAGLSEDCQAFRTKADWAKLFDSELLAALSAAGIEYLPAKAAEPVYERVTVRDSDIWDGCYFRYRFRYRKDLFPEDIQLREYGELRGGLRIIAYLAGRILDLGGKIERIYIGREVDDPYDTGTSHHEKYDSFDSFVESCSTDRYDYYIAQAILNRAEIQVNFDSPEIVVFFPLEQAAAGIDYLHELVKAFGSDSFYENPGSDDLQWDAWTKTIRRAFRLDKAGECYLRTDMNTDGRITGYRLIVEEKDAAQYELPPENVKTFEQILYKETHEKAVGHIAKCCAMYLQHHTPQELIALAEKHGLIGK